MSWTIDLGGQVSLVTGGATGIGAAACRGYAEAGSHVAVNHYPSDRDRPPSSFASSTSWASRASPSSAT